jgi:hypothetical protein
MTHTGDNTADPLFRHEALDYLASPRGPGELLRVSVSWLDATYWAFLLLVVAGVLATLIVHVDGEPLLCLVFPALSNLHG